MEESLDSLTRSFVADFPYQRSKPLRLEASDTTGSNPLFEEMLARVLVDEGFLVRSTGEEATGDAHRILRYRFTRYSLQLTDPQRRSFLGQIWLRRTLAVGVDMVLSEPGEDEDLWSTGIDTAFQDWIPKKRHRQLADAGNAFLAPSAPSTTLEKLAAPIIIGALAGASVTVFLLAR